MKIAQRRLRRLARAILFKKFFRDKLVRSKLKSEDEKVRGNCPCCRKKCGICNILYPSNQFRSTVTGEVYKTFILIAIVIIIILIAIVIVWFICLHVKFVQSNIQDQLLPSLDQDLLSINRISEFTEKEGGVLYKKN